MSDYMFMLENHLSAAQARVVSHLQAAAGSLGLTLFLTGGAMRDMLGGFPIADLDFAVEGNALKMAGLLAASGATILETDEQRRLLELGFPGGVRASAGSARQEHASRPGARPQILQATIHEDLRSRDFTINAIALSLNRGSRGLLLDPNNGLADLGHKELRAITNYTFHDDPVRLLRLLRFRTRLRFSVAQRTWQQYENARQAQLELKIPPPALVQELRSYASEPDPGELLKALAEEGMTQLFSPALSGAKLNLAGF
ncbi:MAG: CCA tRNA nucleotidyltransferase, partial [Acidobacteria bacterium]|nr:CCA tRNA nucleotidyltransferase [Acidobacteriota bacterium]